MRLLVHFRFTPLTFVTAILPSTTHPLPTYSSTCRPPSAPLDLSEEVWIVTNQTLPVTLKIKTILLSSFICFYFPGLDYTGHTVTGCPGCWKVFRTITVFSHKTLLVTLVLPPPCLQILYLSKAKHGIMSIWQCRQSSGKYPACAIATNLTSWGDVTSCSRFLSLR